MLEEVNNPVSKLPQKLRSSIRGMIVNNNDCYWNRCRQQ